MKALYESDVTMIYLIYIINPQWRDYQDDRDHALKASGRISKADAAFAKANETGGIS